MFQVNYNGLKKRDDYDEIVALITHDVSKILYPDRVPTNKKRRYQPVPDEYNVKIKYPNRIATQILNSPYMKQIDNESLTDIQNHQYNINKEQIKQAVLRSIADSVKIPHRQLQAMASTDRMATITDGVDDTLPPLETVEAADTVDDTVRERTAQAAEQRRSIAIRAAEGLARGTGSLIYHGGVGLARGLYGAGSYMLGGGASSSSSPAASPEQQGRTLYEGGFYAGPHRDVPIPTRVPIISMATPVPSPQLQRMQTPTPQRLTAQQVAGRSRSRDQPRSGSVQRSKSLPPSKRTPSHSRSSPSYLSSQKSKTMSELLQPLAFTPAVNQTPSLRPQVDTPSILQTSPSIGTAVFSQGSHRGPGSIVSVPGSSQRSRGGSRGASSARVQTQSPVFTAGHSANVTPGSNVRLKKDGTPAKTPGRKPGSS